jgi:tRNA A-37 threonylcarbamoyl transferase component Bud32
VPSSDQGAGPGGTRSMQVLEERWQRAAEEHLPIAAAGAPWRSNRASPADLPRQGWKLHVSATIVSAVEVLEAAAPVIEDEGATFKGVATLADLHRLNCGLVHGYPQIGKFLTVYPRNEATTLRLAHRLAEATAGMPGPAVPFEHRVAPDSPVFARYGLFRPNEPGGAEQMLHGPAGDPEPDRRDRNPQWAIRPDGLFAAHDQLGPLATAFRAYQALSQRGKGGVYLALDLTTTPVRRCVLKEGRRFGEIDLDGSDGRSRVVHEAAVLRDLAAAGVHVPAVYAEFEQGGHGYLAMEWIEGPRLADVLAADRPRLDLAEAVGLSIAAARLLADVHRRGWVWRDLKATNLLLRPDRRLCPVDFEGAARNGAPVATPWGSTGHVPKEWLTSFTASVAQDRYALGVLIGQLFTNTVHVAEQPRPIAVSRPDVPPAVDRLVADLLSDEPHSRPSATDAVDVLSRSGEELAGPHLR